jgi:hypothetical protein
LKNAVLVFLASTFLASSGCVALDPAVIRELAKDDASVCVWTDTRGGVGAGALAGGLTGGYGQLTFAMCRSGKEDSSLSVSPDGSMSVQNGK